MSDFKNIRICMKKMMYYYWKKIKRLTVKLANSNELKSNGSLMDFKYRVTTTWSRELQHLQKFQNRT